MYLKSINLPKRYNYIACFLSLDCNYKCHYCINWFGKDTSIKKHFIPGRMWIDGLNRLKCAGDLPITLQGGEPSVHPDFIDIINNIKPELSIDILTNLSFNIKEFIHKVDPSRLIRQAPYPNIRVSYHPQYSNLKTLIKKTLQMQEAGFSIGIHGILHPELKDQILDAQKKCLDLGIDFRTKEFLGEHNDVLHGTYLYPDAVCNTVKKSCLCRTSELIIGPYGDIFRCHHDVYKDFPPVGNLLNPHFQVDEQFQVCREYGDCNACDIKVKTNRFQKFGYTAVEIKDVKDAAETKKIEDAGVLIG